MGYLFEALTIATLLLIMRDQWAIKKDVPHPRNIQLELGKGINLLQDKINGK